MNGNIGQSICGLEHFGVRIDPLGVQETVDLLIARIEGGLFTQHGVVNVAKLVHAQHDPALKDALNKCHIVNADGAGIVLGCRALGHSIPQRVAGIDLFQRLLGVCQEREWPVYFLGASDPVLKRCLYAVCSTYPQLKIAGAHHGYIWEQEEVVVSSIRKSGARLLFVGISSPKKEEFISHWRERLGVVLVMGVGGSFDVLAGEVRRAPHWMQAAGCEWLFRLVQEPHRMWRRYLFTNVQYAAMLSKKLFLSRFTFSPGLWR